MIVAGLDIETTSILKIEHRIIELCAQKWEFDPATCKGRLIGTKTWRIHPERSIEPKAYAVHKISLDDLAGMPVFAEVAADILAYIADVELIVAHNGDEFDRPFVRMELERVGQPLTKFDEQKWFDTMLDGRWADPWGKVPTLRQLCHACDVEYDTAKSHAAEYDVTVMMKSFFFGVKAGFFTL